MIQSTFNSSSSSSRKLLLVNGSVRHALTKDDLSNHPDSMLATLYARYNTGRNSQSTRMDSSSSCTAAESSCGGSSSIACPPADSVNLDSTRNSATPDSQDPLTASGTHPDRSNLHVELAGSDIIVTMKATPHNACNYWSDTPRIIAGLYRDGCISGSRLADMLQEASNSKPLLYLWLSQLLSFLTLPGPVINWLPPISTLDIRCAGAMSFIVYCWGRWQAQMAAELILSYKPHESKLGLGNHCSFFMIIDVANGRYRYTADEKRLPACLAVYALDAPSETIATYKAMAPVITLTNTHIARQTSTRAPTEAIVSKAAAFGPSEYARMMAERVVLLHPKDHPSTKTPPLGITMEKCLYMQFVGGDHPEFGEHLLSVLQSGVKGLCKVVAGTAQATYARNGGGTCTLPLWAVLW